MRSARRRAGFTVIEVLVAMSLMAIGMIGIVALMKGATLASGYSRRATEAAILLEDKLEELRTAPIALAVDGTETVDATGTPNAEGPFERTWVLTPDGAGLVALDVDVTWNDHSGEHRITFRTVRTVE